MNLNSVVLKPSEVAPHTAQLMAEMITKYLDPVTASGFS